LPPAHFTENTYSSSFVQDHFFSSAVRLVAKRAPLARLWLSDHRHHIGAHSDLAKGRSEKILPSFLTQFGLPLGWLGPAWLNLDWAATE
jgi:hypothetical protein